ncbi:MAG TPA: ATP-binding protein [Anaerolineae bacterium]|nr:ATP-binding protein [Anaerolineae bacterium]
MTTLYVLIGVPGSGKSSWAQRNAERLAAIIVGSDQVRNDFRQSGRNPLDGDAVFAEVERRTREQLAAGQNVILDATHYLRRYRTYAVNLGQALGARRVALWFDVPLADCLRRNADRSDLAFGDEIVPERIVREMFQQLQLPQPDEFDEIRRLTPEDHPA